MTPLPEGTISRAEWGARSAKRRPRLISPASRPGVEIHHSVGTYKARDGRAFARSLQADHLGRPNYADAWYSLLIWRDGQLLEGRGAAFRSAPTDSLTVCLAGNYDRDQLTDEQAATIRTVRRWLIANGGGDGLTWHGQRARVGCPGRNVIDDANAGRFDLDHPADTKGDNVTTDQADRIERLTMALVAVEVASIRNAAGREADPDSDYIWASRIGRGIAKLDDAARALVL